MKPLAAEWIRKAEGDYATVLKNPNFDGACFHAQQCAEKYLKARLCQAGIRSEKVHDLVALLDQVISAEPAWEVFREDLAWLSSFAVAYRYPGESADIESARDAKARCQKFRLAARKTFGLPTT